MNTQRPKIGLALSGASGRAIAHAGVLDVLDENGIAVDYIAACSSATIIAAAYAAGTLPYLRQDAVALLTRKELWGLFQTSTNYSGIFSLEKVAERLSPYMRNLRLEKGKPTLSFVTVDINTGEQVNLNIGDAVKAMQASCSVPGLFETVKWGNRNLVDGGMVNIVPADVVKEMGADIVISVDIAASRFVFSPRELKYIRNIIYVLKAAHLPYAQAQKLISSARAILGQDLIPADKDENDLPSLIEVMEKVLDLAAKREKNMPIPFEQISDIILEPKIKHLGRTEFNNLEPAYQEGRRVALEMLPKLRELIAARSSVLKPILPLSNARPTLINTTI